MTSSPPWPSELPGTWKALPHRCRASESARLLIFERLGPDLAEAAADVLRPMVQACLPGYGDRPVPGRCLAKATVPVLFLESGRVRGFAAIEHVELAVLRGSYLTVAALDPALRGRGLLREALRTEQPRRLGVRGHDHGGARHVRQPSTA